MTEAPPQIAETPGLLESALEQLRHSDRVATLGRLASSVAHELGTPLNVRRRCTPAPTADPVPIVAHGSCWCWTARATGLRATGSSSKRRPAHDRWRRRGRRGTVTRCSILPWTDLLMPPRRGGESAGSARLSLFGGPAVRSGDARLPLSWSLPTMPGGWVRGLTYVSSSGASNATTNRSRRGCRVRADRKGTAPAGGRPWALRDPVSPARPCQPAGAQVDGGGNAGRRGVEVDPRRTVPQALAVRRSATAGAAHALAEEPSRRPI